MMEAGEWRTQQNQSTDCGKQYSMILSIQISVHVCRTDAKRETDWPRAGETHNICERHGIQNRDRHTIISKPKLIYAIPNVNDLTADLV